MTEQPTTTTEAFMQFADFTTHIVEAIVGHRTRMLAEGFAAEAVDQMCVDLHQMLCNVVVAGAHATSLGRGL